MTSHEKGYLTVAHPRDEIDGNQPQSQPEVSTLNQHSEVNHTMKQQSKKPTSTSTNSQEATILAFYKQYPNAGLNKYEACRDYGIDNLAARVKGLRYKGYKFGSIRGSIIDLFGIKRNRVSTYFFEGHPPIDRMANQSTISEDTDNAI